MKLLRRMMNCMRPWRAIVFQSLCKRDIIQQVHARIPMVTMDERV